MDIKKESVTVIRMNEKDASALIEALDDIIDRVIDNGSDDELNFDTLSVLRNITHNMSK